MPVSDNSGHFSLSQRTVQRYISLFQRTRDVQPVIRTTNGPHRLFGDFQQLYLLIENPTMYLHDIQMKLQTQFGVTESLATQVVQNVALQQSEILRAS